MPRNKEFLDLCRSDPNQPSNPKNARHPCFKLEANNLHDIELRYASDPSKPEPYDSFMIVKDGDLTHYSPRDTEKAFSIYWNEAKISIGYRPSYRPGCFHLMPSMGGSRDWRMYIMTENGDEIEYDTADLWIDAPICWKWTRLWVEKK